MPRLAAILLLFAGALCAQESDTFLLYRVAGRTWTIKSEPGAASDQNNEIQYMRYEVLEVHEEHAVVSRLRLDKARRVPKGVEPSIMRIEFKADRPPFAPMQDAKVSGPETLKVGALSLECDVYTITVGNATPSRYFISRRYPGLVVREEAMNGVDTLVEFEAFAEDEPPKKDAGKKKAPKEPPKKEEAPVEGLYAPKKPWLLQTRTAAGTAFTRYEFVKFDGDEVELKITELDEAKKPRKGGKAETVRLKAGVAGSPLYSGADGTKVRVEKRKSVAGVLVCAVYRVKLDGKEAHIWVSEKYPGLVVRVAVGEYGKEGLTELCEFKE